MNSRTRALRRAHLRWSGLPVAASILAGLAATSPAAAQEGAADRREDDIMVVARNRDELLSRVPESVVVVGASEIEQKGIAQISDVLGRTPNLSYSIGQDPGLTLINIRGMAQMRNGEPPVAFVIDGVQINASDSFSQKLYDIESIQILKGPQGAYYGRNASGGAIIINTKRPTDTLNASVEAGYANGNQMEAQVGLRGPIVTDRLSFSLSASALDHDGLIPNVTVLEDGRPRKVDFRTEENVRGRLIFTPTDRLTIDLRGGYQHLRAGAAYYVNLPDGQPNNTAVPVYGDEIGYITRTIWEAALKLDYALPFATVTSITGYSDTDLFLHEDLDWTDVTLYGLDGVRRTRGWTQELRLTSPSSGRLRWMVGVYGMWLDRTKKSSFLFSTDGGESLDAASLTANEIQRQTDAAAFGQVNYDITDRLEATVALRYDREGRRQRNRLNGEVVEDHWSKLQPKASLAFRPDPNLMVYATYGVGFRSGGFNPPSPFIPDRFAPETVESFELGFKGQFFDRRLTLNGAFFRNNIDDYQIFTFVNSRQGLFTVDKSHVNGFELEAKARLAEGLEVDAALGLQYSKIDDYVLKGASFESIVPIIPAEIVGNRLPLSYKTAIGAGVQYGFDIAPGSGWRLTTRVDYTHKSGLYWTIDNKDKEKPRNLFDLSMKLSNGSWSFSAFVNNLTNQKYTLEFFPREWCSCAFGDIRYPSEPRRYGIRVKYSH